MIDSEIYHVYRKPKFFWQPSVTTCLIVAYYDHDNELAGAENEVQTRARHVASYTQYPIETKVHKRMFTYDIIFSDPLSTNFRLDIWDCHVDSLERYVFNLLLVDSNNQELGMSASDGQWYETRAACEAAGRLYYLMKYADIEDKL